MASSPKNPNQRVYFTQEDNNLPIPNLIAHQIDSWKDLKEVGMSEIFAEVNPIEDYTGQKLALSFKDYRFEEPKVSANDCKENNTTYESSLIATVELLNKVTGETKEQEIYLGSYPEMTTNASFIINGIERVIVSQLIRSAGVFFTASATAGHKNFGAKMIPGRGAWLEFETTSAGAIYVKIDRRRKMPATTLLRALGYGTNKEIKALFEKVNTGDVDYIEATLDKETSRTTSEALLEVFRRLRPGDLATVDNAREMIEKMFYDFRRFDYSRVGRYKINQRLGLDTPNDTAHRVF